MYMPRPRWLWQAGYVWQAAVADLNLIITGSQISCISFNGLALTNKFAQVKLAEAGYAQHTVQMLIFSERAHKYHSKDSAHKYMCPGRGDSDKQLQMWILSKCAHKYNSMAWRSQIYLSRSRRQWQTGYVWHAPAGWEGWALLPHRTEHNQKGGHHRNNLQTKQYFSKTCFFIF